MLRKFLDKESHEIMMIVMSYLSSFAILFKAVKIPSESSVENSTLQADLMIVLGFCIAIVSGSETVHMFKRWREWKSASE